MIFDANTFAISGVVTTAARGSPFPIPWLVITLSQDKKKKKKKYEGKASEVL